MSRIAEAFARAGKALPAETAIEWDVEREAAEAHLAGPAQAVPAPAVRRLESDVPIGPKPPRAEARIAGPGAAASGPAYSDVIADVIRQVERDVVGVEFERHHKVARADASGVADRNAEPSESRPRGGQQVGLHESEVAIAVRRIFGARGGLRSVMFCTVPGDPMCDVAWEAAESLAAESGRPVALVEDATISLVPRHAGANALITRIGLGRNVSEIYSSFGFVIINATAAAAEALLPLVRQVDGVIVVVSANQTRADAAAQLVHTFRSAGVHLVGAILVTSGPSPTDRLFKPHA
jgi:hypothetical protein